jgi:thioredoxin-like negative regulator of GroEL
MAVVLQAGVAGSSEKTYAEAYYQSTQNGRPLVVMLGADWCPACVKLKNSIMPQVAQTGGLTGIELAYVDVDKEPALAKQLVKGGSIPQLVRFEKGPKGWESKHMIGAQTPTKVAQFISGVEEKTPEKKPFPFSLGAITRTIGFAE